jgi:D-alanyl-D-alanine carboxypeptidase
METVCTETGTPGAAAYVITRADGEFSLATGLADIESGTEVALDQRFRIGSLTKSFTGSAIVRLAEEGLLDLNAPVSSYLDLLDGYDSLSDISVRQVLNMSSGLDEYATVSFLVDSVLADPLAGYSPEYLLHQALDRSPEPIFTPGTGFCYTNTNYVLLGLLIETLSDKSYEDYIQEQFIAPLGLEDTFVTGDDTFPEDLARGYYDSDGDGEYEDWTEMNMSYVWSAGCVASTARDVAFWMDALAGGGLAHEAFQADLFGGQEVTEGVVYGAGILVDDNLGIGHNGTVVGYHADAWHDPLSGATVAVICNTNSPLIDDSRDVTREILEGILMLLNE